MLCTFIEVLTTVWWIDKDLTVATADIKSNGGIITVTCLVIWQNRVAAKTWREKNFGSCQGRWGANMQLIIVVFVWQLQYVLVLQSQGISNGFPVYFGDRLEARLFELLISRY